MSAGAEDGARLVRLPLHSCEIHGQGGVTVDFVVPCVRRGNYMPLQTCLACSSYEGLEVTEQQADVRLSCDSDAEADVLHPSGNERRRADLVSVSSVMTTRVVCIREDLSLAALGAALLEADVESAPVIDSARRPVGMITRQDYLRWFHSQHEGDPRRTARDIMAPMAFYVPAQESVAKTAALMAFESVQHAPVVSPSGQLLGIVTAQDILGWLARSYGYVIHTRGS